MDDWNGDVKLINHHLNFGLNFDFFSAIELDWWFTEENVALLFYLSISNSNIFVIGDHEVLINGVLINLLLLDSSNHFFFLEIDVSKLGHQFDFSIVIEFDESLSLFLFLSSSFSHLLILLLSRSLISLSFSSQVVLSSLPKILLLFLSNDVKSSSLSFNHEFILLHHNVVVLLSASLNGLDVWR